MWVNCILLYIVYKMYSLYIASAYINCLTIQFYALCGIISLSFLRYCNCQTREKNKNSQIKYLILTLYYKCEKFSFLIEGRAQGIACVLHGDLDIRNKNRIALKIRWCMLGQVDSII